jgi:hypothetical protein
MHSSQPPSGIIDWPCKDACINVNLPSYLLILCDWCAPTVGGVYVSPDIESRQCLMTSLPMENGRGDTKHLVNLGH